MLVSTKFTYEIESVIDSKGMPSQVACVAPKYSKLVDLGLEGMWLGNWWECHNWWL